MCFVFYVLNVFCYCLYVCPPCFPCLWWCVFLLCFRVYVCFVVYDWAYVCCGVCVLCLSSVGLSCLRVCCVWRAYIYTYQDLCFHWVLCKCMCSCVLMILFCNFSWCCLFCFCVFYRVCVNNVIYICVFGVCCFVYYFVVFMFMLLFKMNVFEMLCFSVVCVFNYRFLVCICQRLCRCVCCVVCGSMFIMCLFFIVDV